MFKNLICGVIACSVSCVNAMDNSNFDTIIENNKELAAPVSKIAQIDSIDRTFRKFVDDPFNNLESFHLGLLYVYSTFPDNQKLQYIYDLSQYIQNTDGLNWVRMNNVEINVSSESDFFNSYHDMEYDDGRLQEIYSGRLYHISYMPHFDGSENGIIKILIKGKSLA